MSGQVEPLPMQTVLEALCNRDPRYPCWSETYSYADSDEPPVPRVDCACDNCFYGRDRLAVALLATREVEDVGSLSATAEQAPGAAVAPSLPMDAENFLREYEQLCRKYRMHIISEGEPIELVRFRDGADAPACWWIGHIREESLRRGFQA